jgi:putative hydrolase of the HAD superfamily
MFDVVFLSYKEGIAKPNPDAFRLAAEKLGLAPEECVMIDDIAENCEGAEVAGMQSIQHVTNESTIAQLTVLLGE